MITHLLAAMLLASTTAQPASRLSQENQALVRCAAAFSIVSYGQQNGNEAARKWPALGDRAREFFVRSLAQIMDDTGLDRDGISQLVSKQAQEMWDRQEIDKVMPSCLVMLEASGV